MLCTLRARTGGLLVQSAFGQGRIGRPKQQPKQQASRSSYCIWTRLLCLSAQFADPVCLPCLPTVSREGLFHARRFRRNIQPDVAHQNRAAFILFLVVKLPAVPTKFANDWRYAQNAFVQIEQIDAPLTCVRVVQPERLRLDVQMLLWIIDLKLLKIGVAIEELLMVGDPIVLDPILGTDKTIG